MATVRDIAARPPHCQQDTRETLTAVVAVVQEQLVAAAERLVPAAALLYALAAQV
jgi:hypothetical protein